MTTHPRRDERLALYCVEIRTQNWAKLVEWYREVLGLRVLVRVIDDGYALLGAGETRIALVARDETDDATRRISLAFEVSDLRRLLRQIGLGWLTGDLSGPPPRRVARGHDRRPGRQSHPLVFLAESGLGPASARQLTSPA